MANTPCRIPIVSSDVSAIAHSRKAGGKTIRLNKRAANLLSPQKHRRRTTLSLQIFLGFLFGFLILFRLPINRIASQHYHNRSIRWRLYGDVRLASLISEHCLSLFSRSVGGWHPREDDDDDDEANENFNSLTFN